MNPDYDKKMFDMDEYGNLIPKSNVIYKADTEYNTKNCFCVGPENCSDKTCRLVKEHKAEEI